MELFIALATCIGIAIGVTVYKRWFFAEASRRPEFEAWCRTRPLLLALHRPGGALDLAHTVRGLLAPHGEYGNRNGTYPWQHYVVTLQEHRLDDDVLGLFVIDCRLRKERVARPDLEVLVSALEPAVRGQATELWLHGQLHASERPAAFDRNRMGWTGRAGEEGAVELHEMIGAPAWLAGRTALAA